jgi:hypothetical protein
MNTWLRVHFINGPQPVISSNQTEKEAFTLILVTTAAGHKLPPACFLQGKTNRVLKSYSTLAEKVQFFVAGRWVNQEMWERYVTEVIIRSLMGILLLSSLTLTRLTSLFGLRVWLPTSTSPASRSRQNNGYAAAE